VRRQLKPISVTATTDAWHWPYRVRALGPFQLLRSGGEDGGTPPWNGVRGDGAPRGMPLRLLQATLALGGRGVAEVQVIDALWPDAEGDAGRRVFDTTLHRLRKQLGDDAMLRLIDGRLHIDERLCWVDIWAFEETIATVKETLVQDGSVNRLTALSRRLLDVYRGPLCADAPASSTFLRGPRSRLAAKFLHTAETLGRALENRGRFDDAAHLYERVLEGDHAIELAYAGLLRCALGAGRHTDGLRLFHECRSRMRADLGEEPGGELERLYACLTSGAQLPQARSFAPVRPL